MTSDRRASGVASTENPPLAAVRLMSYRKSIAVCMHRFVSTLIAHRRNRRQSPFSRIRATELVSCLTAASGRGTNYASRFRARRLRLH